MIRKLVLAAVFLLAISYLLYPSPEFPELPPGGLQSVEPADTESVYRRAYFTNLSREEIMSYYWQQFGGWGVKLVIPPEDSFTVIRDQTRVSYLEEFIHPLRESIYVGAYVPTTPVDQINRNGVHYLNKVTIKYIPSHPISRITILFMLVIVSYFLLKEYGLGKK